MKISSEAKIGIIVTLAIAATIWGLNYLKGRNLLTSVDHYSTVYSEIGGLEKNSKIFINGYRVGQVGEIKFNSQEGGSLNVILEIRKDFNIPLYSTAVLYDADFMGTKAIRIELSSNDEFHTPGDTIQSVIKPGLTQQLEQQLLPVKDQATSIMVTFDSLITAVQYVFDRESADHLKASIESLEQSLIGIEEMVASDGKLTRMIDHLESITQNLKQHNQQLASAMSNIESITDSIAKSELKSTINNASLTLQQTHQILEKINNGEGTVGLLVNNDTLYHNLEALSRELDLLLKDLQENPKKYINVSVFGRSETKK
jgi:phospholipid/cholesterol/gamma-HCH transport system substrate-binding protein